MHTYCICGLTIASNIPLPELGPTTNFDAECRFWLNPPAYPSERDIDWFHEWQIERTDEEDSGEPWARFARREDGYLVRFPSCADFSVSLDVSEVRCVPLPDVPEVTVRHLLLDQVLPLILSRRERIVLHASAVSTKSGVIAFAGRSGRGKSTLAMAFAQQECALVSDDCLVLRRGERNWTALPSYPGVRVWQSTADELAHDDANTADVAHYTDKRRIADLQGLPFAAGPEPLLALFVLADEQPTISVQRLTAAKALMAWAEFAYNLDITDAAFLRAHFESVGQLAAEVPAHALYYPREFSSLEAVRVAIRNCLEEMNTNDPE